MMTTNGFTRNVNIFMKKDSGGSKHLFAGKNTQNIHFKKTRALCAVSETNHYHSCFPKNQFPIFILII